MIMLWILILRRLISISIDDNIDTSIGNNKIETRELAKMEPAMFIRTTYVCTHVGVHI